MSHSYSRYSFLSLFMIVSGCTEPGRQASPESPQAACSCASDLPAPDGATVEIAPPPRELIYLEVTPAAARFLTEHARKSGVDRWWLRYEMVPGGCSGFQNKLWMEDSPPAAGEFEYMAGKVRCVLLERQRHLIQGVRIDYDSKDGKSGFLVTAPHATARTKDSVSKWIMDEFDKRNPDLQRPSDSGGTSKPQPAVPNQP